MAEFVLLSHRQKKPPNPQHCVREFLFKLNPDTGQTGLLGVVLLIFRSVLFVFTNLLLHHRLALCVNGRRWHF